MPRGLELLIAQTILQGFDAQYGRFLEVTSGAQQRFEQADWHAIRHGVMPDEGKKCRVAWNY
ncbi:bifunctional isocitrate dehydrogenase kinase/phosphatase protein [Salmonella enterica subsp. salamae]|uniref:Bifunctional isocitrate dehydrogenase kinase/phosphatase protein n=1 Tax=Salmonella enterica subsp. salamae TaxID=59202 RepID=A0A6D2GFS0_SALER